jgi:pyruvate dehydrogenase E2 component (dihydrolipoamide acetyltransferase)
MPWLLRMPEVAANAVEAVLQEWQVEESAAFSAEDTLATVETEKAVVDVEAETDGVLLRTLVPNGAQVEVGAPIALLGEASDATSDLDDVMARLGVTANGTVVRPERREVGDSSQAAELSGAEDGVAEPPAAEAESRTEVPVDVSAAAQMQTDEGSAPSTEPAARIFVSPLARRLARDAGMALETMSGTGPRGRILRRDVEAAVTSRNGSTAPVAEPVPAPPVLPTPAPRPGLAAPVGSTDVPHSRMRRAIAKRLSESKSTIPHFYVRGSARVDELLRLRAQLNESAAVKISLNDLVVKAAARAHTLVPAMNVVWTEDAVRSFSSVDIALAVATDRGLLTPVVRGVDSMTVSTLAAAVRDLAERAKVGRLRQEELEGGSMSVTNLGMFGTEEFAAIINPPQSAILAVGAARQEPVVEDGLLAVGTVMRVTLSVDHRPVDGVLAAEWMRVFLSLVERPLQILA